MKLTWWQRVYLFVMLVLRYEPREKVWEGATVGWSPKGEYGERVAGEWVKFDAAVDEFSDRMNALLWDIVGGDPVLMVEVLWWGESTMADTGSYDLRELEALLSTT